MFGRGGGQAGGFSSRTLYRVVFMERSKSKVVSGRTNPKFGWMSGRACGAAAEQSPPTCANVPASLVSIGAAFVTSDRTAKLTKVNHWEALMALRDRQRDAR